MNMLKKSAIALVAFAALGTGCTYTNAVVSTAGKTYVVKSGLFDFSQKMFHCEAPGGTPVCTEVEEQEL